MSMHGQMALGSMGRRAACLRRRDTGALVAALALLGTLTLDVAAARAASTEKVFVLELGDGGAGETEVRRVSSMLRTEVAGVVGRRLVEARGQNEMSCPMENMVPCAADLGRRQGVQLVFAGTVAALADAQMVDLRLVDVRARAELGRLQSPLGATPQEDRQVLRELAVRLVAPQSYAGTLQVSGLAAGDSLAVDGAEVKTEIPQTRLSLPVGQHAVEVLRGEETLLSEIVDVAFEGQHSLTVGAAAGSTGGDTGGGSAAVAESGSPGWPFWTTLGVSAVSVVLSIGLITHYFAANVAGELEDANQSLANGAVCTLGPDDPPDKVSTDCFEEQKSYYTMLTVLDLGGSIGLAVVAVGAGIAAVLLASSSEDSDAAAPLLP